MAATGPRRGRRAAAATVTAVVLALTPVVGAAAEPPPRPHPGTGALQERNQELAAAKQQARETQQALARTKAAFSAAQQELTARSAAAQVAIETYAKTMKEVRRARRSAAAAQAAADAAAARAAAMQQQVRDFARAAYISGGPMTSLALVLTAGNPGAILNRAALLGQVSQSQAEMLHALVAAQQEQVATSLAAAQAAAEVEKVAARADAERRAALVAMANTQALLGQLSEEQEKVTRKAAQQESTVAQLAKERDAARQAELAAQRAALAAAWVSMQAAGDAMPWATAEQGRRAVAWAKKQLGVPYSWAGGDSGGPTLGAVNEQGNPAGLHTVGFDCSGLTLFAWAHAGFNLDHYTGYQWVEGHRVELDDLRAGDLVFFAKDVSDPLTIHHVGIYVDGDRMIDAPHTGAVVRYDKVFVPGLIGAVRP